MEGIVWNCNGLGEKELNQLARLLSSQPQLHFISLSEVKRDLRKDENLLRISAVFPESKWHTKYTTGTGPGKGLFTAIRIPDTGSVTIEEKTTCKQELAHISKLVSKSGTYKICTYYVSPNNKRLSNEFIHLLEDCNLSAGDLNRSQRTQPERFKHYKQILEFFDRVELIDQPTFIPHTSKTQLATTTPDSCISDCTYNESVRIVNHSTLTSDHLATSFLSDFCLDFEHLKKEQVYYAYESLDKKVKENEWNELPDNPSYTDIDSTFSDLLLKVKRKSSGSKKDKNEYNPAIHGGFDQYFDQFIGTDTGRMSNVRQMFQLAARFEGTENSLNDKKKVRQVSRRSERSHFVKFKDEITKVKRLTADEELRYQRIMRQAKREMEKQKVQPLYTLAEYDAEFTALKAAASPGPDKTVKSLFPDSAKNKLKILWFINDTVFRQRTLPPKLLQARLQFIDKQPKSEKKRPLCCGQRFLVLITRLAAARLEEVVNLDSIFQSRFGFRRKIGVEEYIGSLITKMTDWKSLGSFVGLLQTDISGAYTSVNHKKLILAIFDLINRSEMDADRKPWYLVLFTEEWLDNRVIFFRNTRVVMKNGVPQGDGYSPIAFLVYLAYECADPDVMVFYYADDLSILIRAPTAEGLLKKSQKIFENFKEWCEQKNMKADPEKSKFMLLGRTKQTLDRVKHHFPDILDHNFVMDMRVLGVQFDSNLNFVEHVDKICNRLRVRINLLRKMKKIGLGIRNAMQFAVCTRASLHFGLWWTTLISEFQWKKLERCWSALLKTAIHEKTPKSTNLDVIREISGHSTIRNFCHYLMQLRTCKLANSTTIKRFTLNEAEFIKLDEFQRVISPRTFVQTREATRNRTDKTKTELQFEKLTQKLGPLKTYTFTIATSRHWELADFHREKEDLRLIYSVHAKVPKKYLQMSNDSLYWFLVQNSYSYANTDLTLPFN